MQEITFKLKQWCFVYLKQNVIRCYILLLHLFYVRVAARRELISPKTLCHVTHKLYF
jgi:hypothetical protein